MTDLQNFVGYTLDEKYRLEKLLGQGGMGAVYLATHLGTERPVALKIIVPQFMENEEFVARFRREARAAGRLRHPNVVDVTDFGTTRTDRGTVAYLVMEYLDGCTLGDVLAEESSLPLDWIADIMEQTCSAVSEAHRQGIVHRDLKPENIWLEPTRLGGYRVKVLDFGIAKLAEEQNLFDAAPTAEGTSNHTLSPTEAGTLLMPTFEAGKDLPQTVLMDSPPQTAINEISTASSEAATQLFNANNGDLTRPLPARTTAEPPHNFSTAPVSSLTRVGAIMGTPAYMSPEQCRGTLQLDARSDVYSLGVITYQMLAGQTPFQGDMLSVMRQHAESHPPPLKARKRRIPKKVARLVNQALAKNPAERPQTAIAFANALRANAEGTGSILRRAFALYSEHFPSFLRISLLVHIPLIVLAIAQTANDLAKEQLPSLVYNIAAVVLGLSMFIVQLLTYGVISGVTVLIVLQLIIAPLRPVQIGAAFRHLRRRAKPFITTALLILLLQFLGFFLLIIGFFIISVRYTLYSPVVLVENLRNRAAMRRAKELMRRARGTVIAVFMIHFLLPVITQGVIVQLLIGITDSRSAFTHTIGTRLALLVNILLVPLMSVMTALVYLKTRRAGGETTDELLAQFEESAPRTNWQQRMRERLTSVTTRKSIKEV
jgi:serine/threonine protein kinase